MSSPELKEQLIKHKRTRKTLHSVGFFGRVFFTFLGKVVEEGNKETYNEDKLTYLEDEYLYADYPNFKKYYEKNKKRYKNDFFHLYIRYTKKENRQKSTFYVFR